MFGNSMKTRCRRQKVKNVDPKRESKTVKVGVARRKRVGEGDEARKAREGSASRRDKCDLRRR
jgi:hypothetical protein